MIYIKGPFLEVKSFCIKGYLICITTYAHAEVLRLCPDLYRDPIDLGFSRQECKCGAIAFSKSYAGNY